MASPTVAGDGVGGGGFSAFVPQYWDSVLGENLYPNLYLLETN